MSVPLDHPARVERRAWVRLREELRARAGHKCECIGECGLRHPAERCFEEDGEEAQFARGRIVLTMAHLCGCTPPCLAREHLKMLCQRCHLRFDTEIHQLHSAATRHRKNAAAAGAAAQPECSVE